MTSPIGRSDDDQMAPGDDRPAEERDVLEGRTIPADDRSVDDMSADDPVVLDDDQIVLGSNQAVADDDRAGVARDQAMPDDDRVRLGGDQLVPDDDQIVLGSEQTVPDHDQTAAGTATPGRATPDRATPDPVGAGATARTAATPASASAATTGNPDLSARWPEIQAMFVDDPRASVERAAGLVDDSVEALVVSVKEQQHALLATWQGDNAGTEELRTALQGYRAFWNRVDVFSRDT
jgi:hypothetical protein